MRVIAGSARGRRLKELQGTETRPTTDKVKEGIFSAIQFDIEGRKVLDLFAGTGQLGIEALSRGAKECSFVDKRRDAISLIKDNLELCQFTNQANVHLCDSIAFLERNEFYDIVFLDPPYASTLLTDALDAITRFDICNNHAIIVAESPIDMVLPQLQGPYKMYREYRYGQIKVTVFHKEQD